MPNKPVYWVSSMRQERTQPIATHASTVRSNQAPTPIANARQFGSARSPRIKPIGA